MGDIGARLLAKALQINNKLRMISLDRNNVTLQGEAFFRRMSKERDWKITSLTTQATPISSTH